MKQIYFSRKIRQLKFLRKQLENHRAGKKLLSNNTAENLYIKGRELLKKVYHFLSLKEMKRIAAVFGFTIFVGSQMSHAQDFKAPVNNPFGFDQVFDEEIYIFGLADWDNDGDLDIFTPSFEEVPNLYFIENIGSSINPQFDIPISNPNALFDSYVNIPADIDNDGDLDIIGVSYDYDESANFSLLENIGTASVPDFAPLQYDAFGTAFPAEVETLFPAIGDLDNDGDLDFIGFAFDYNTYSNNLHYFENIGNAENPQLDAFQIIDIPDTDPLIIDYIILPTLVDLDEDGDLDILTFTSAYDYSAEDYASSFQYFENTGSPEAPNFVEPIDNPFGLEIIDSLVIGIPSIADLDGDGDTDVLLQVYEYEDNVDFSILYFENTTGVGFSQVELVNVQVFPNPSSDIIQIICEEKLESIQLFDVKGQLVKNIEGDTKSISLHGLPSGSYSVRCRFEDGKTGLTKIIKQ